MSTVKLSEQIQALRDEGDDVKKLGERELSLFRLGFLSAKHLAAKAAEPWDTERERFFKEALVAIAGAVCTPERGYEADGGFGLLVADIKAMRSELEERAQNAEAYAHEAAMEKFKKDGIEFYETHSEDADQIHGDPRKIAYCYDAGDSSVGIGPSSWWQVEKPLPCIGADAMLREIEQLIPRNDAHRDYTETVALYLAELRQEAVSLRNEAATANLKLLNLRRSLSKMWTVKEWFESAPPAAKDWLRSVTVLNFIAERRRASFAMPGAMDGAMSEACKALFRREYDMLTELQEASRTSPDESANSKGVDSTDPQPTA